MLITSEWKSCACCFPHCWCRCANLHQMLDIAIVGAGPAALALVSRLVCEDPDCSASFCWGFDSPLQKAPLSGLKRAVAKEGGRDPLRSRIRVFEKHGRWLAGWDGLFSTLGVEHLRSPHIMHPCPTHTQALQAHVQSLVSKRSSSSRKGSGHEVGAPAQDGNHAAWFKDFEELHFAGCHRAPSTEAFSRFCAHVCEELQLNDLIERAEVVRVQPVWRVGEEGRATDHFILQLLRKGETVTTAVRARAVVVATGATCCPNLPDWMETVLEEKEAGHVCFHDSCFCHSWDLPHALCSSDARPTELCPCACAQPEVGASQSWQGEHRLHGSHMGGSLKPQGDILVVGGGLTSVQLAGMAAKAGIAGVTLTCRGPLRVQQFDVGAAWMDRKQRPALLRRFMQAVMEGRARMLKEARGTASIPPEALQLLDHPCISVEENTSVAEPPTWDASAGVWHLVLVNEVTGMRTARAFNRVWCATGSRMDVHSHPILGPFCEHCPIGCHGGLPCLTPWLAWSPDIELYVLGAPAALVLGPDASNLMGARTGSCRVAHVLQCLLDADTDAGDAEERRRLVRRCKEDVQRLRLQYDRRQESAKGTGLPRCPAADRQRHSA